MNEVLKKGNIDISGEFENLRKDEGYKNALNKISGPENQEMLQNFFNLNLNPGKVEITKNTRDGLDSLKYSLS